MLAITGGKGGTGTTTTALGLGVALAGPTLVVDGDWAVPDLHRLAGVTRHGDDPPPDSEALWRTATPASARHTRVNAGPDSPPDDEDTRSGGTRVLAPPADTDATDRKAWFRGCRRTDARVLVDCPSGVGPPTATLLRIADGTIPVTTACAPAVRDTRKTTRAAAALGTPTVATVVTRARTVPPPLARADAGPSVTVPAVAAPVLQTPSVRAAYDGLADRLAATDADHWV
ncbi:MinD/ParA family protein [Halobaculum sp. MBLA0147]|uniref:MinD/ParA family ATP-binding protein n=1 Tax=Halobaculum sp. MBLA0147 TaxID=3079934 RepID=UPI003523D1CD